VLGFIVVGNVGAEWELENIAVAANARRRGLAARLMNEFMDVARGRGADNIFLEVRESNHAARALYNKWAFVETGRRKNYYSEPVEDAVVYRFEFAQNSG
jgi:[ribosomal protein S18]-alanine N-acetyltransferase